MAEIVPLVAYLAGCLVAPVCRQCRYMLFSDREIRKLENEVEKLKNMKVKVDRYINARHNKEKIKPEVCEWQAEAQNVVDEVLDSIRLAKGTCFCRCLPYPPGRYYLGKKPKRLFKEIRALLKSHFEQVSYENDPPGYVGSPDVNSSAGDWGDTTIQSRTSILEDIMNALDDATHQVIGVYGPSGVGKSWLLEEVEKKLRHEKRLFDVIAKATVSQTWELKNIQDDIAYALSLDLNNVPSNVGRADLLLMRLQLELQSEQKKILIILDDLQEELDLKAVGIPSGGESRGCKLLLTSRYKDVLQAKMCTEPKFHLEGLKDDEAVKLFEKTVGDKLDDEELKAIAPQVVKKLAGLPLLIISMANTLKHSDEYAWRNALINTDKSNMEAIVKLSYDHLKSEDAKSLFLVCGLIGGTLRVEILLVLGMTLGLFGGFNNTLQDSRDRLSTMLDELYSASLLQDGGDDKENVTIHDLYSEMVISNTFSGQNSLMINSNYGSWPKEKLEKCWACLVNIGNNRLAKLMSCRFPHVKILMLLEQNDMEDCCRMYLTYMKELQALCLCSMYIPSLPSSMGILKNLHLLYLECCSVEDVAILGKLKALQILSLAGSAISRLPKEIGELTNLRLLNLNNCDKLEIIEPCVLKSLINLEELHMKGSFDQWMGKDEIPSESHNARLVELKSLTKLTSLEISIPNLTILLEDSDLSLGSLIKFWINIGNAKGRKFKGLRTMELKLEGCDGFFKREWVQKTLHRTQDLHLDGLRESTESAYELCAQGFPQLKHLNIQNSSSIKYIADSTNGAFTILESLLLKNLINLEKICHALPAPKCFSKVKVVSITRCDRLIYLWCLSHMESFIQLKEIEVLECGSMRAIVTDDISNVATNNIVELPNVRCLELAKLPNMMSLCTGAGITSESAPIQVSFPRLESLVMIGLNLEELGVTSEIFSRLMKLTLRELPNLQRMWKQDVKLQKMPTFCKLKQLIVYHTGLAFLFPVRVAKCLRKIRFIEVKYCPNMKAVIMDEEDRYEGMDDIIEFPLLKKLHIFNCPTEKFFSCPSGKKELVAVTSDSQDASSDSYFNQKVSLPSLEMLHFTSIESFKKIWHGELPESSLCKLATLTINNCSSLLKVFPSTIIGRLHNLKLVKVSNCPSLESLFDCGSLDSNMEQTRVLLPNLVRLYIKSCPSLKSLFDCGSLDSNMELLLPKLENVEVSGARSLRHFVKNDSQMVLGFPSLTFVWINSCSELRYLFPYFTATTLEKLERLRICHCEQMKEVISKELGGRSKAEMMSFPCLSYLTLDELNNLICFSSGSCSYDFPSLKSLEIRGCHNFGSFITSHVNVERPLGEMAKEDYESPQPLFNEMVCSILTMIICIHVLSCLRTKNVTICPTILFSCYILMQVTFPNLRKLYIEGVQCKESWNNQIPTDSFSKLEWLKLKKCDSLQRIAPSHIWKRLQCCLEILEVRICRSIEIICEGDVIDTKSCKLRKLVLHDLGNLRHIWQSDGFQNILFPNLRSIEAWGCPRLEKVFPTIAKEFLGQIKMLDVQDCENMELIAGHEECEEAADTTITFFKLTTLRLKNLPKLRKYLPEKYSLEFPSMERLYVCSCGTEPNQGRNWYP